MSSLLRRASAVIFSQRKGQSGAAADEGEGGDTAASAPFAPDAASLDQDGVRVKSRAIKTVHASGVKASKAKHIPKTAIERELIVSSLKGNMVFSELNPSQMESMVLAFDRIKVKSGIDLIVQGTPGDFFYVVETGSFDFIVNGRKVGQCGACGSFGELALLYDTKRAATVRCTGTATVFALNRDTFKGTLSNDVQTSSNEITETLRKVPIFKEYLRLDEIQRIADVLELVKYPEGSEIIRKGDVGTTFYIIKEGTVLCKDIGSGTPPISDVELSAGRYFGERALISNDPRAATVVATTDMTLLSLNGENFKALLGGLNSRMAAAAEEEDRALTQSQRWSPFAMSKKSGGGATSKKSSGWTFTTRPDIKLDVLQEVAKLGSGSFGYVRMVLHEETQEVFALKSMLRSDIKEQRSEQSVLDEKDLMAEVANPFIVNLVNTYKSSKRLYMLMECVQGGELYSRIHTNRDGPLDSPTILFYAANLVLALAYLHEKDIVYRDLKPENVLVNSNGYLKICDFGFATRLPLGTKTYTLCGTVEYLAPELLIGKGHNRGVDWWAFGVLLFEMFCFRTPFEDKARKEEITMRNILKQSLVFPDSKAFDDKNSALITSLLQKNPLERLGSEYQDNGSVFKQPYFAAVDFEGLRAQTSPAPWVPPLSANTDSSHFDPS